MFLEGERDMSRLIKVLAIVGLVAGMSFSVSACNTIEGIGKDAKAAGEAISGTAQKSRNY